MLSKSSTYFDLLQALPQPGCAVCRLVDRYAREHIDAFFYEQITNVARRAEIREARGYCSLHAAMLPAPSRMLGIAILHHDVLTNVLRDMAPQGFLGRMNPARAVRPSRECQLCAYERDRETHVLHTLICEFEDRELRTQYDASDGVCLPHFASVFEVAEVPTRLRSNLIKAQSNKLALLRDQLEKFIASANASGTVIEPDGAEVDAPLRSLKVVSGRIVRQDGRRK